jgi:hypothetical protein
MTEKMRARGKGRNRVKKREKKDRCEILVVSTKAEYEVTLLGSQYLERTLACPSQTPQRRMEKGKAKGKMKKMKK